MNVKKNLAILGATGSIGCSTLDIVRQFPDRYRAVSLTAGRNVALLARQIAEFRPALAVVIDEADRDRDGALDCLDGCPDDPDKIEPGVCGCGLPDAGDADSDGVLDCVDLCQGDDRSEERRVGKEDRSPRRPNPRPARISWYTRVCRSVKPPENSISSPSRVIALLKRVNWSAIGTRSNLCSTLHYITYAATW